MRISGVGVRDVPDEFITVPGYIGDRPTPDEEIGEAWTTNPHNPPELTPRSRARARRWRSAGVWAPTENQATWAG